MTDNNEVEAPVSDITKQVLENLQREGAELKNGDDPKFNESGDLITEEAEPAKEEEKAEETKEEPQETKTAEKVDRKIDYVPTWKLKVAEDQKAKTEQRLAEAQAEIERLSQKETLTKKEQVQLDSSLQEIAEEYGVDTVFLEKLKNALTPKELQSKLETIEQERNKIFQETKYDSEFAKDILPLVKSENPDISDTALLQLKEDLKAYAFSEEYQKLPLAKIFRAERDVFKIPQASAHKKTVESSRSGVTRSSGSIDFDNMTETDFLALPEEQKLAFLKHKAGRK